MDIFEGKNKRYCKRLTKFGRNIVLRIKPRAAMFVVRFANLSLARYLTNPRVIAWLPALKGPLEPRLITVLSLLKRSSLLLFTQRCQLSTHSMVENQESVIIFPRIWSPLHLPKSRTAYSFVDNCLFYKYYTKILHIAPTPVGARSMQSYYVR